MLGPAEAPHRVLDLRQYSPDPVTIRTLGNVT